MTQTFVSERELSQPLRRLRPVALVVGVLAAAVSVAGLVLSSPSQFFQSYLFSYLFWLELSLGSLAVLLLHYLVGGSWGMVIRRILEAAARTTWLMALLFIPLALGLRYLYPWAVPEIVAGDALLQHKSAYLNVPFFLVRAAIFFAVWILLSWRLVRWAGDPASFNDPLLRRRFQRVSAFGLIAYALTMTFASVDWIMSLQPGWFSSIYGMVIIVGQALAGYALASAILPWVAGRTALAGVITPSHYRDLGAFLLSFVVLWAYVAFSQFLIIWGGNIPREATWYLARIQGGWLWVAVLLIVVQFILPFMVLLSLTAKRSPRILFIISIGILAMRLLNYFWEVTPAFHPGAIHVHWLDLALPIAMGGLWLALFSWYLPRTPLQLPEESPSETAHALPAQTSPSGD